VASGALPSRRIVPIHLLRRADGLAFRARRDGQPASETPSLAAVADEVTVTEAAALLGVTVYAVHGAMKRRSLPHRRVGSSSCRGRPRRWRIAPALAEQAGPAGRIGGARPARSGAVVSADRTVSWLPQSPPAPSCRRAAPPRPGRRLAADRRHSGSRPAPRLHRR
jgi:hypothetical protein